MKSLIFSNQHVEMILSGRKTMTRRLVKQAIGEDEFPSTFADRYARPGDCAVVKEPFWRSVQGGIFFYPPPYRHQACSPIHLPWKDSRCAIEVVSCRVERLLDMPEEDLAREGYPDIIFRSTFMECVWDKLNPRAQASTNPWVYVVEFRVVKDHHE